MDNEELYHHGILGQKWGIRRFQKSDGTLTSAGKKRRAMSQDAAEAKALKKKKLSEMSNAELRKLNERQNLERTYKTMNPSTIKKAIVFAGTSVAAMTTMKNLKREGIDVIKTGKAAGSKIVDKLGDFVLSDINRHF